MMKTKDAERFRKLAVGLEEVTWSLDTSWRPKEPYLQTEEDAWVRQEVECRVELDRIVTQWVWDRFLPELPDRQKYFLRLRFVAAYRFLYQFTLDDHTTVFAFPEVEDTAFLIWMLTTWWHSVGSQEALTYIDESFTRRRETGEPEN